MLTKSQAPELQPSSIPPTRCGRPIARPPAVVFAHPALHLKVDAERPDVLELEGRLLPDDPAVVPRLAVSGVACRSHDGPPLS